MTLHDISKTKTHKHKKLAANSVTLQRSRQNTHVPVLLDTVVKYLAPQVSECYLDTTAGYGGHAARVGRIIGEANLSLIDCDPEAQEVLKKDFPKATIYSGKFAQVLAQLKSQSCQYDMIMADLGVSSPQLDNSRRGFSFLQDAPLDMRMDPVNGGPTVAEVITNLNVTDLTAVIRSYGEESKARLIAQALKATPPSTTIELADLVKRVKPGHSRKHPATKTFQALRIYVNQELEQLSSLLELAPTMLKPAGRLAIITFHSLEDRLVKRRLKGLATVGYDSEYLALTKKPVRPSQQEIVFNPRARSAKLRVLQRK